MKFQGPEHRRALAPGMAYISDYIKTLKLLTRLV